MTIDALAWLEQYEAERLKSPEHMYGVRSYIDSECTTDYDPHVHAADLSLPVVTNDRMPTPQMVACYSARHRAVFIRPNLVAAIERCALAHEIVHFEHNDIGTTRSQEDRADRIAARRLIRPSRLEEVASTTDDHARMALELGVTERIMRFYLRSRIR